MQRPLSDMERAFYLLDRGHPFNGVQVVSLRGPLTEELLSSALLRLSQRHPALRSRIVSKLPGDERRLILTDEGTSPIPLRIVPRRSDRTWEEVATQEMNQRFADGAKNLTRAVWVRGSRRSDLVFGQHHVTCDALSFSYAVRDLCAELFALSLGQPLPPVESLPLRPPLPSLLPRSLRGVRRFSQMTSFFWKHVLLRPLRRARKLEPQELAPPDLRRSGMVHGSLGADETRALSVMARQQGTTVHAGLCAALILAVSDEVLPAEPAPARGQSIVIGCSTAVNLRRDLDPALAEEMGLFVSQVTTFHRLQEGGLPPTLWELARDVKAQLHKTLRSGEQYLTMPLIGMFIPRGRQPGPRFIRRFDGGSPAAVAVTNIGAVPIPLEYGPFVIEDCQFVVSPSVVSPLIATASTCRDVLNLNLVHVEPLCSQSRAAAILGGALRRLQAAALPGQKLAPLPNLTDAVRQFKQ